jgi:hypothetical protein
MTTATQAYASIRSLIEANKPAAVTAMRWQDEAQDSNGNTSLPDTAATFIYTEFLADKSFVVERGGGVGNLRNRCPAHLEIFVLTPKGQGLVVADGSGSLNIAEAIAAFIRPYRLNGVTVESATAYPGGDGADLKPKGLDSAVDNYSWSAVEVDLYFDLIG